MARDAYLERLGLELQPPSVEGLFDLHRAQVSRVVYETLWIHLGERWGIEIADSFERVARQRRGGYCFHLNGAFSQLLSSLGYRVTLHVGGVHGPAGPTEEEMTNHLVLTVHDLPTPNNPSGTWYVDVGLGDALFEPLPLVAGTHQQGPFRLGLEETPSGIGQWHLSHDPLGTFAGMSWREAPATIGEFAMRHQWLSTSPDSGFVKVMTVQRRDATGVDSLRGLTFRRVGSEASETTVEHADELADVLSGRFGVSIDTIGAARFDELWTRTQRAHLDWEAAGRP